MGKVGDLIYKEEVYKIVGSAIEVHKVLGRGFLESVYHEALEIEFSLREIPFESRKQLNLSYKENPLQQTYQADYLAYDKIIVEIKALDSLIPQHQAQVINYLKATKLRLGILINFGEKSLVWKRIIL
jgi:GxxExxY protein